MTSARRLLPIIGLILVTQVTASTETDIEYAKVSDLSLQLDLHHPGGEKAPLIVYVHGGAWRSGSKSAVPIAGLLEHGFAIASVDYRLSTQAQFPAQIHDIKAAIRFLRAHSDKLRLDSRRIAIIGTSAGGHLAALAGVTHGHAGLEGQVGDHLDQSSQVNAIVSLYGASNLESILGQSTEFGLGVRIPALKLLLGGLPEEKPALAKLASPVVHLDAEDPPLALIHGDADPQMPIAQSHEFQDAYQAAGLSSQFLILPGAKHGGPEFYDEIRLGVIADFLHKHLGR